MYQNWLKEQNVEEGQIISIKFTQQTQNLTQLFTQSLKQKGDPPMWANPLKIIKTLLINKLCHFCIIDY